MQAVQTKAALAALLMWGALTACAQTGSLTAHTPGGPDLVLRDVRIGATYTEINAFTARAEAFLPPENNATWAHLSLRLDLLLDDGSRRELTMQCSACAGRLYTYFESSPWEATHVKGFAIGAVSGDYIAEKQLPAYAGRIARDAPCYRQMEAGSAPVPACVETTDRELAVTLESNQAAIPDGAVRVVLTSVPGDPPETHFGLIPKRLVHLKAMHVLAHVPKS